MNFRNCRECNDYKLIIDNGKCNSCINTVEYTVKVKSGSDISAKDTMNIKRNKLEDLSDETDQWIEQQDSYVRSVSSYNNRQEIVIDISALLYEGEGSYGSYNELCQETINDYIDYVAN